MQPIDALRRRLGDRRRELLRLVTNTEDEIRELDTNVPAELEEEAQEAHIATVLAHLDDRGKAEIEAIDRAMTRIARGDYGTCEDCEEPIPLERLHVLPTATTCVDCAAARESAARMRVAS
jgi:RNA polymerase-binding transcription factor